MTNIILLNHFYGYPVLMDECSNNLRYAQLLRIIDVFSKRNTIFYCNSFYDEDDNECSYEDVVVELVLRDSSGGYSVYYNEEGVMLNEG